MKFKLPTIEIFEARIRKRNPNWIDIFTFILLSLYFSFIEGVYFLPSFKIKMGMHIANVMFLLRVLFFIVLFSLVSFLLGKLFKGKSSYYSNLCLFCSISRYVINMFCAFIIILLIMALIGNPWAMIIVSLFMVYSIVIIVITIAYVIAGLKELNHIIRNKAYILFVILCGLSFIMFSLINPIIMRVLKYNIGSYSKGISMSANKDNLHYSIHRRFDNISIKNRWLDKKVNKILEFEKSGKYDKCVEMMNAILLEAKGKYGENDFTVGLLYSDLAIISINQERYNDAIFYLKEANARILESNGVETKTKIKCLHYLAYLLSNFKNEYEEAEQCLGKAIDNLKRHNGRLDERSIEILKDLGIVYSKQEKYKEALSAFKQAHYICIQHYGKESDDLKKLDRYIEIIKEKI